ncbi:hypothetical protein HNQ71_004656 [Mesorhizobium sangaii]|uniref:Uncharacterized protein n=1 Tax=Mesorhizobium sangaii TaxID=505389 RepID=A0A841PH35_9HYPH|nr:hypothetical protein [Mesorhizobium sangaii]
MVTDIDYAMLVKMYGEPEGTAVRNAATAPPSALSCCIQHRL